MFHRKKPRRNRLEVVADVLEATAYARQYKGKIMKAANMSWKPFNPLLEELVDRGLVKKTESAGSDRFLYYITQNGEVTLQLIHRLRDALGRELW